MNPVLQARKLACFFVFVLALGWHAQPLLAQPVACNFTNAPVQVGNDWIEFVGVVYEFDQPNHSTWYYCVESGARPNISHTTLDLVTTNSCALKVTACGTWAPPTGDPGTLNENSGSCGVGPSAPTQTSIGLKWDEELDAGTRGLYYFTVEGNFAAEPTLWHTKAGNGFDSAMVTGPSTSCRSGGSLPVELQSMQAHVEGQRVYLTWETASETDNAGFEIEQATRAGAFQQIGFVRGQGTSLEPHSYSFHVDAVSPGVHTFRLKQIDFDGTFAYSPEIEAVVETPAGYVFEDAFPNPFTARTGFRFSVEETQEVRLELYDVQGRLVKVLYQGHATAGRMQEVEINGAGLPGGVYFAHLIGRDFSGVKKVMRAR